MSYETVLLPKFSSDGTIILVKYQFGYYLVYFLNCVYFDILPSLLLFETPSSLSFVVRHWLDIIRHDWTCRIECNLEFSNIFCSDFDLRVKCKENGVFSVGNSTVRRSILRMFCQFVFSHKKRTFVRVRSRF